MDVDEEQRDRKLRKVSRDIIMQQMFENFALVINERLDLRERITRMSRELTLDSKKLIFHLQRYSKLSMISEDRRKLDEISNKQLNSLKAKLQSFKQELSGHEQMFIRQISMALQEYVESICFHYFINEKKILPFNVIQSLYTDFPISMTDYLDGLMDFTGEIMRFAISSNSLEEIRVIYSVMKSLIENSSFWNNNFKFIGVEQPPVYVSKDKLSTFASSFAKVESLLLDQLLTVEEIIE